jgi:hypothetical protein
MDAFMDNDADALDLSAIPNGTYFLRVKSARTEIATRIVKE